MTSINFKNLIVGTAATAALAIPSVAMADPTCVYVQGVVDSVSVSTPAVIVVVPDSDATVQPVRVHLDEEEHSIIGYSMRTPGVDEGTTPQHVFVPGTEVTVNPIVATTPQLPIEAQRCVNQTVSTPAIPIYVPESVINTPGAFVTVPVIELNILGNPVTTAGKVLEVPGNTIVIPAFETAVPGVSVTTPAESIRVTFSTGATLDTARFLAPTSP